MGRLEGKTALITGAAGAQGRVAALTFARQGARVALADINEERVRAVQAEVEAAGGQACAMGVDVTSEDSVKAMVAAALARFGTLNVLYNNAGINNGGLTEAERDVDVVRLPLEIWQRMLAVNLTGVFLLTQTIGKRSMLPRKYGRILTVASIAGLRGNPPGVQQTLAYNTTKAAW